MPDESRKVVGDGFFGTVVILVVNTTTVGAYAPTYDVVLSDSGPDPRNGSKLLLDGTMLMFGRGDV
jgi:hypothetical protein